LSFVIRFSIYRGLTFPARRFFSHLIIAPLKPIRPLLTLLLSLAATWALPGDLAAQVVRLPAVVEEEKTPPGQLVSHPDSSSELLEAPGQVLAAPAEAASGESQLPPGARNGIFQKALFDGTWLAPGGAESLGLYELQLRGIFALPCPTIQSPMVITPGFAVQYIDGSQPVQLPPRLYEGFVQFRWLSQATPKLGLDLSVTPGVYSDFEHGSNEAFRLTGHGAAAWTWNETTKLVAGAAYLARPDVNVIPIGGIIWTPRPDVQFDLIFPEPKAARRVYWNGHAGDDVQDWLYVSAEFTGDVWAVGFPTGVDRVLLSDYRLILGVERKVLGGLSSRFEVGYVFGRHIRYGGDVPDFHPTDTVMLRGTLMY